MNMKRTPIDQRELPDYTRGEEIMNMVTHIVGGGIGVLVLIAGVILSALKRDAWGIVSAAIYGLTMIWLYTMSSVYHGLRPSRAKKVLQVLDHCTIYALIAGTYTPILLAGIRPLHPVLAWVFFGLEWALLALATTLTAIDLDKYDVLSMICYIAMGWLIILAVPQTIEAMTQAGFYWLLRGRCPLRHRQQAPLVPFRLPPVRDPGERSAGRGDSVVCAEISSPGRFEHAPPGLLGARLFPRTR